MRILLVLSTLILLSEQNVISELYKVVLVLNAFGSYQNVWKLSRHLSQFQEFLNSQVLKLIVS